MGKVTQIILIGWLKVLTATKKINLHVLTCKSSKYLFYRFNDILKESNFEVKKVKNSVVTDDYIATEETQNQN